MPRPATAIPAREVRPLSWNDFVAFHSLAREFPPTQMGWWIRGDRFGDPRVGKRIDGMPLQMPDWHGRGTTPGMIGGNVHSESTAAQGQRSPRLKVIASKGRILTGSSSFALAISTHWPSAPQLERLQGRGPPGPRATGVRPLRGRRRGASRAGRAGASRRRAPRMPSPAASVKYAVSGNSAIRSRRHAREVGDQDVLAETRLSAAPARRGSTRACPAGTASAPVERSSDPMSMPSRELATACLAVPGDGWV